MAFKRSGGGSRPTHYISVTAKVGNGKYEKGPYIGLWAGEKNNDPLYRGNLKGKYLDELFDFIKDFGEEEIGFAIFKSRGDDEGSSRRGGRDDSDDNQSSRRGQREEPRGRGREEKEEPRGRGRREEPAHNRSAKGKKDDWFE